MRTLASALCAIAVVACGDNLAAPIDAGDNPPDGSASGPGTITTSINAPFIESGAFIVTLRRIDGSFGTLTATYATADGTATAGVDYEAAAGSVTWQDGDTSDKTFNVVIIPDLDIEMNETILLTIDGTQHTLTIIDDDRMAQAVVLTSDNRLVEFDPGAPTQPLSAVAITGVAANATLLGIDFRPASEELYALTSLGTLYTIDRATGAATLKSTLVADAADTSSPFTTLSGARFGMDFNPVADRLRVVSDTGQNLRINVDTGATTTDTAINGASSGYTAVAYTNSFGTACRTALYAIDPTTDRLLLQSPPNDGVTAAVGAGSIAFSAVHGFDIASNIAAESSAFAILDLGGAPVLTKVDLTTGSFSPQAALTLEPGERVVDLALTLVTGAVTQPAGELYALSATGRLVNFTQATPGKACSSNTISGISGGDTLVDLDFRPSTGALYVLAKSGTTGTLYTVDPTTGVGSNPVVLGVALAGTQFGMDFNPTGPVALRIVSDTGQNLRVTNVATGATVADGALNGAATGAASAGYTDSLLGAGTTTLYVIDTAADRLRIQSPPNAGTLVDVGPLGNDVTSTIGFDIDGQNNVAFAAVQVGASTTSNLHTLDLATGALSASLGTIAGGELVVGLTRAPRTLTMYGLTASNQLVTLSVTDPSMTTIIGTVSGLQGNEQLLGLDFRPSTGVLYALGSTGRIYSIAPSTAAASHVSTLTADASDSSSPFTALGGTSVGFDFNPTTVVALRVVSDTNENLRIPNVLTGATFTDTDLNRTAPAYSISAVAYSNNIVGATTTALFGLDDTTDRLVAIAPPNAGIVREIGALGMDVGPAAAFEIVSATTAIAVFQALTAPTLVTIDLTTGSATSVGTVNAGGILAMSAPINATAPAADSTVFAITTSGNLISFPRDAPGSVTTVGPIVGPLVTEVIVGLDARPDAGGALWLLTRTLTGIGRLYTVNTSTGVATFVTDLVADASDTTSPYTVLPLAPLGMDFNPTGTVPLRLIASDGTNLRVANLTTGATFTDADLNVPEPDVVAAAYTNSFAGATATSLLVIDTAIGSLMRQDPPNAGTLVTIGALSPAATFTNTAAFDIAGGSNGIVFAALQRTIGNPLAPEAFSRLYRINLATGAATEIGSGIGGSPVRGLAIQIR